MITNSMPKPTQQVCERNPHVTCAVAIGIAPSYEPPYIPTNPLVQAVAFTSTLPSTVVKPFARPLSQSIVKLALTGAGVLTLVSLARFRVFRLMRASALVHLVLVAYLALVGYELLLLDRIS